MEKRAISPYEILKRLVVSQAGHPAWLAGEERFEPENFGSARVDFVNGERVIRVFWDGREGVGFVRGRRDPETLWSNLGPLLTQQDLGDDPADRTRLKALGDAVKAFTHESP